MEKPKFVYVTVIKAPAEKIWDAITKTESVSQYFHGGSLKSSLQPGTPFNYFFPDGRAMIEGKVIEAIKPKRLVTTFDAKWSPEMPPEKPSRVTYEIEARGDCCKLTLIHDEFEGETAIFKGISGGWPAILAGLKTYLETGKPLGFNAMSE